MNKYVMIGFDSDKDETPNGFYQEFENLDAAKDRVLYERYLIDRDGRTDFVELILLDEWLDGNYDTIEC